MAELRYEDRFWTKWYREHGLPEVLPDVDDKFWREWYKNMGIPEEWGRVKNRSLADLLIKVFENTPADREFVICAGYAMTAMETLDKVKRLVSALKDLGVKRGDTNAIFMSNGTPFFIAFLSNLLSGATTEVTSSLLKKSEILRQMKGGRAKVVFCTDDLVDIILSIKDETSIKHVIVASTKDFTAEQEEKVKKIPGTISFRDLLEKYEPIEEVSWDWRSDDVIALAFTGGATGRPKGVQVGYYTFEWLLKLYFLFAPIADEILGHLNAAMVVGQHMFHIGYATMLIGMFLGRVYIVQDPRDIKPMYKYMCEPGSLMVLYAPRQAGMMVELAERDKSVDLKKIGHIINMTAMAAPSPETASKYEKMTGIGTVSGWGLTECIGLGTIDLEGGLSVFGLGNPLVKQTITFAMPRLMPILYRNQPRIAGLMRAIGPKALDSIMEMLMCHLVPIVLRSGAALGRTMRTEEKKREALKSVGIPLWNVDIKVVDLKDQKTVLPVGETGEICFNGPNRMVGYLPTDEYYTGPGFDEDGFVHTGDVGYMDKDGALHLVDRSKDMINVSGFKVYAPVVEDLVYKHPAVSNVAAIAVPDEEEPMNERVKLVVQLKKGVEPSEKVENEIVKICRDELPPYAVPRYFEFIDEIPMIWTDKIDKMLLREMHKKIIERGELDKIRVKKK